MHKAEEAASLAAQDSIRHGHKAETRVADIKDQKQETPSKDNSAKEGEKPAVSKHLRNHAFGMYWQRGGAWVQQISQGCSVLSEFQ